MKKITKYIVLSIIAVVASSWQCQSRGPRLVEHLFKLTNKSQIPIRYFTFTMYVELKDKTIKDSIISIFDLEKEDSPFKYAFSTDRDIAIKIELLTAEKETIATIKTTLENSPIELKIDKHIYLTLQPDSTIKTNIIDVPWDDNL